MDHLNATLSAKPNINIDLKLDRGPQVIGLGKDRDGLVFVPRTGEKSFPLLILLHGAGGKASQMLVPFRDLADQMETVLLIPESREQTWDIILGSYGPDVRFIDKALIKVFNHCQIDPDRIAIGGFSDGASYALSLGITNGDFFSHIMAYSPGFMAPPIRRDSPPIFISHGTKDNVLPIDHCSRRLVPILEKGDLEVSYHEFNGPHTMPPEILKDSFSWFLGRTKEEFKATRVPVNEKEIRNT